MRYFAQIPCTLPRYAAAWAWFLFMLGNILFVAMHLWGAHPSVQSHFGYPLDSINLDKEANLPTNWAILQLYLAAGVCTLMVFRVPRESSPVFWKVGAAVLLLFGFDESAQLHELWSAGIFPRLFGHWQAMAGNRPSLLIYGILLGGFYLSAVAAFAKSSPRALSLLILSGLCLVVAQAAEVGVPGVLGLHNAVVDCWQGWLPGVPRRSLQIAWEEGLELTCYSLIVAGVLQGGRDTQATPGRNAAEPSI